jgi:hypothetical protein
MRRSILLLPTLFVGLACTINATTTPPPSDPNAATATAAPPPAPAPSPAPTTATATPTATATATPTPTATATATATPTGTAATGVIAPAVIVELADPPEAAVEVKLSVSDGRPKGLVPGATEAFWIWQDKGDTWHVRTTTKTVLHRFQGSIVVAGAGTLAELKGTKLELNDHLRLKGNKAAHFDFSTQGHEDGFDFKTTGNQCVKFHLRIDGRAEPALINIGANNVHPARMHFKLCP